jgi:hypothetical protein
MSARAQHISVRAQYRLAREQPEPFLVAPRRGALEEQLERLKERLLLPIIGSIENAALVTRLRAVANEAAAMAWFTVCPVLVLPTLLEEKVRAALQHWERQQLIQHR